MASIYGHRWTSGFGDSPEYPRDHERAGMLTVPGDTWHRGLAGIEDHQIGAGLDACMLAADDWPPSLPKFRAMCFAIPSLHSIRAELKAKHTARSPFARQVWSEIDPFLLRQADHRQHERMLREAYDAAVEFVVSGGELPVPLPEIAAPAEPVRTQAKPETVRASTETIEQVLADPEPEPEPTEPTEQEPAP